MAEEHKRALIRRRAAVKCAVTRFTNFIRDAIDSTSLHEIKARTEKHELCLSEFETTQAELEALDDDDNIVEHDSERNDFENAYFSALATANRMIELRSGVVTSSALNNSTQSQQQCNSLSTVRLPTLNLPDFDGSHCNWPKFRDSFSTLIHENLMLTNIQKFVYLQSCLKGKSAEVIEALEVSNDNYTVAWKLLTNRFENDRLVVNIHVKALFDLPAVHKEHFTSLRKLLDEFLKHFRALEALKQPVHGWDTLLVHLIVNKLDNGTRKAWETSLTTREFPTVQQLICFLTNRCDVLEMTATNIEKPQDASAKQKTVSHFAARSNTCTFCKKSHTIYSCQAFARLSVDEKWKNIKILKLCSNCLSSSHFVSKCSARSCFKCGKRHHTLLHATNNNKQNSDTPTEHRSSTQQEPNISISTHCCQSEAHVLLSTAYVYVADRVGNLVKARALIDSGSDSNYITRELHERLGLKETRITPVTVAGINGTVSNVSHIAQITIKSLHTVFERDLNFLIINKITGSIPIVRFNTDTIAIPKYVKLCDPNYNIPSQIDLLIGAEVFYELLLNRKIYIGAGNPVLQETELGWLVTGKIEMRSQKQDRNRRMCHLTHAKFDDDALHEDLQRFWKLDDCATAQTQTPDEKFCEKNFVDTTTRNVDGRFVVSLPFKNEPVELGDSAEMALKRQKGLEFRFKRDPKLKEEYVKFMKEYVDLEHMEKLGTLEDVQRETNKTHYYIPHHAVLKSTSSTTKLRVVYNASMKTTNDKSLNDFLRGGPVVQSDLYSMLIRFRCHNVVISADIEKMFRQVLLNPQQRDLHRIVWRENDTEPPDAYRLKTVTYGTAPATFLTTRCIKELGMQSVLEHPIAARAIIEDMYVDDLISGADTIEEAKRLKDDIREILFRGKFQARKWRCNFENVLADLENTEAEKHFIKDASELKTLGVAWNSNQDTLGFTVDTSVTNGAITKRTILSTIARVFDPLGLASPIVLPLKILIQELWSAKLGWDDPVPKDIEDMFISSRQQINLLHSLEIPRHILTRKPENVQIHGFCDSSEKAYGAAVYVRSMNSDGTIRVNLLCAKTRVTPLKRVSLPRLELCSAVLLAKLMRNVLTAIRFQYSRVFYWSDSTIVLCWLKSDASRWKTFVANRVAQIHNICGQEACWRHVDGKTNPADLASRAAKVRDLGEAGWWTGPKWLTKLEDMWPLEARHNKANTTLVSRATKTTLTTSTEFGLIARYSNLSMLERVVAWCRRFKTNCLGKTKLSGPLSIAELEEAFTALVNMAQRNEFSSEIERLSTGGNMRTSSQLSALNPFIDESGSLRVGSRLRHGNYDYNKKYPLILPKRHPLTELVIKREHLRHIHLGATSLLAVIRERFWPIAGLNTVKSILRKCVICRKLNPVKSQITMGNLPAARVNPAKPFANTSLDFAGPFLIKETKHRNRKFVKVYVCIFVCMAVKAVHIELVTDLSCQAFLNAFKRFIARRGLPVMLCSDNATNFVAANKELNDACKQYLKYIESKNLNCFLTEHRIVWKFIPARSPHMGGLHEAAVKSMKRHLKVIMHNQNLTCEDFSTILCQIEAILNSRPLFPTSPDPDDLTVLTPGHFLVGEPLTALPDGRSMESTVTTLKRWQQRQQMTNNFWKRWEKEYLCHLQTRNKWKTTRGTRFAIGDLVLVRDDTISPQEWRMGRITVTHPGAGGEVRVVTLKTKNGITKRATARLCRLPMEEDVEIPRAFKVGEDVRVCAPPRRRY